MKVHGERGREALYIGCVCMCTDHTSISVVDSCYERLKEDRLSFREKGKVVLLGDFNARVGRSMHNWRVGKNTCNASRNRLPSFLNEIELMICDGKNLVLTQGMCMYSPCTCLPYTHIHHMTDHVTE